MALKLTIDDLVEAPGNLRSEYKQGADGKFHLQLDGVHPDSARVGEFRERNIALLKSTDELKARVAELESQPESSQRTTELETQLAAERTAHAATVLKAAVTAEFLKQGGRGSAIDFMAGEAAKAFTVEDGKLVPKDPDAATTVEEWITKQVTTSEFAFQPSRGGGAPPRSNAPSRFGATGNQKTLRNPTAQELGQHAADIAAGRIKVEHS